MTIRHLLLLVCILVCALTTRAGEIHEAAKSGNYGRVKQLLDADPTLLESQDFDGETPLHIVSIKNQEAIATLLLERGAKVDARNYYGWTPMIWAAFCGNIEFMQILLDRGAEIDAKDNNGLTALHWAAAWGYPELIDVLVYRKAQVDVRTNAGLTPLHEAIFGGFRGLVPQFLSKKADVNAKDNNGMTPVHYAAMQQVVMRSNHLDWGAQDNSAEWARRVRPGQAVTVAAGNQCAELCAWRQRGRGERTG